MIIELLTFQVDPSHQATFLAWDDRVWTAALSTCDGYRGKAVWSDREQPNRLQMVIRWQSWEHWKRIDPQFLAQVDQRFQAQLQGLQIPFQFVSCQAFDLIQESGSA